MSESKTPILKALERPPVDDALIAEITRRIVEACHPRRVILFGSRARGDARPDSDVDILVEMETKESRLERFLRVIKLFRGRWWSMDLIVMTPEEVRAKQHSLFSIVPVIEREGKVLYQAMHDPS
jgi:predicted nucleotidyltransferase